MRLLKSPSGVRVVPRPVLTARAEAEALLAQARTEASALVAAARAEADAVRDRARSEGEAQARAHASALQARAAAQRAAREEGDTAQVAELALEVARTILGREAGAGPEVLRDVTQRALARVRRARRVLLHVHPDEVAVARASCRAWLPAGTDPELLDAEADPSVERGGVIVESELGRLDARLDTQLAALRRALEGA